MDTLSAGSTIFPLGGFCRLPSRRPEGRRRVDLAGVGGIPIRLSQGAGVESVDITMTYDPALLTVHAVLFSSTLPADALTEVNLTVPGMVRVGIAGPSMLAPGAQDLFTLQASVPADAPYRGKQVLRFTQADLYAGNPPVRFCGGADLVTRRPTRS
jgi:hypothetical protein